jgi:peptidoglycan hydrolase-like protein with peptidoglycan-binding domain
MALVGVLVVLVSAFVTTGTASATDPTQLPNLGKCQTMRVGSRGLCVEALQYSLKVVGMNVQQDGQYGPQTKGAVKAFQAQQGLQQDGIAGPITIAALDRKANAPEPSRSFRGCPQLKPGVFDACVDRFVGEFRTIPGNPYLDRTKLYDDRIARAVRDYQARNGLVVDGVAGQQTSDLVDVQAGPEAVCVAQDRVLGKDGVCQGDGAVGSGKSVWSCVKDIFGVNFIQDIAHDYEADRILKTVDSKAKFIRFLARSAKVVGSAPLQGAVCVSFG